MLVRTLKDLSALLFPYLCNGCGIRLVEGEREICMRCLFDLPFTDFHIDPANKVARQFWGRLPVSGAMAMLHFKKGGVAQALIHSLKYRGRTGVGIQLGEMLGKQLIANPLYEADLVIPVPLHPKKMRTRGYNQSFHIALGVVSVTQAELRESLLTRALATGTQTNRSRYKRYENMKDVFVVNFPEAIAGKRILLVDDVITTGATLEACGNALLDHGAAQISIAAIAFAE